MNVWLDLYRIESNRIVIPLLPNFLSNFATAFTWVDSFDCRGMLSVCCLYFLYSTNIAVSNVNYFTIWTVSSCAFISSRHLLGVALGLLISSSTVFFSLSLTNSVGILHYFCSVIERSFATTAFCTQQYTKL